MFNGGHITHIIHRVNYPGSSTELLPVSVEALLEKLHTTYLTTYIDILRVNGILTTAVDSKANQYAKDHVITTPTRIAGLSSTGSLNSMSYGCGRKACMNAEVAHSEDIGENAHTLFNAKWERAHAGAKTAALCFPQSLAAEKSHSLMIRLIKRIRVEDTAPFHLGFRKPLYSVTVLTMELGHILLKAE
ncbi:hypothetical protein EI94DRAFT_1703242 [Lactarius quietus]|nr:hypothetical protein EI94DRAFT_1703242 [Lactarius quietus]